MTPASAPTPLAARLAERIRHDGPISIADYMAACLGDPDHGYYLHREPFGAGGDFVTAPEVSQMFGELIGAWCVAAWLAMGAPARFVLIELGPGRGTLMADLLRAGRVRPAFAAAVELHLVETSRRLRATQAATLASTGTMPHWHDDLATIPAGPSLVIANEFFDALPVRQFVRNAGGWAERMVGLGADGRLAFGLRPAGSIALPPAAPEHAVAELGPAREAAAAWIGARLARDGGAALAIDYGHAAPGFGDTLQAVRAHRYEPPLAHPGLADLTAHVDFAALAAAAAASGAEPRPVMTQGTFLAALGLRERAAHLAAGKDAAGRAAIAEATRRLAAEDRMGTLFKVLCLSAPGLALAPFDRR